MDFSIIIDAIGALAVTALLAEGYGFVRRKLAKSVFAPYILGCVFGLIALVQMYHPLEPFDGLIIDMRNIPIALAGAFLGWRGLLPCLAIAMLNRFLIGGVGMESGLLGMLLAGFSGFLWSRRVSKHDARTFGSLLLLGLAMSSHLLAVVALPHDIAVWFVTNAAAPILALNMVSVPLMAALLEREHYRIRRDNRLVASASRDPLSGILLPPAFAREMANAYTARAFGTYAGFLTITPVRGLWRAAVGLFGEPAPVALDRQTLAVYLEHAELAGLCADGRILVPLSSEEVRTMSRVKSNLKAALRSAPSATIGTAVEFSIVAVPDPTDFLRITETAVVAANVDWNTEATARRRAIERPDVPSRARRSNIFNREEHDILFAKADFLIRRRKRYAP